MFELADTKGAGSMWQPLEPTALSLNVQMIWSIRHKLYPGCCLFLLRCLISESCRASISVTLEVTPLVSTFISSIDSGTPTTTSCLFCAAFHFPSARGSCNKPPEVLIAGLIWLQNDNIQFRLCSCLFPCAFGDEILFVISCGGVFKFSVYLTCVWHWNRIG